MVLPSLDGSFGGVGTMDVRWNELEGDIAFFKGFLEFVGAFVVQYVYLGHIHLLEVYCAGRPKLW